MEVREYGMNTREAFKIDTEFYSDFDSETETWCVFGNNSGVAYFSYACESSAEGKVRRMNNCGPD